MTTPKPMLSAQVDAIKGHQLSTDKTQLSLVLEAKHVGDLSIVLSTEHLEKLAAIITQVKSEIPAHGAKGELKVTAPKTWMVTADTKIHDVVLLIFNRNTEAQTGYALAPDAAKGMADAIMKNADVVLKSKGGKQKNGSPKS